MHNKLDIRCVGNNFKVPRWAEFQLLILSPLRMKLTQEIKWVMAAGLFPTGKKPRSWGMGQGWLLPTGLCLVGLVRKQCYLQKISLGNKELGSLKISVGYECVIWVWTLTSLCINLSINNNEYWMLESTAFCSSVWISLKLLFVFYSLNLLQLLR